MPDTVIHRVEALAKGEPELLTFTDRKGCPIGEVELTGVDGNETPSQNLIQESISQNPTEPTTEQADLNLPAPTHFQSPAQSKRTAQWSNQHWNQRSQQNLGPQLSQQWSQNQSQQFSSQHLRLSKSQQMEHLMGHLMSHKSC